jgi:hypothetical protein
MATEAQLRDEAVAQLAVQGVAKLGLDLADMTLHAPIARITLSRCRTPAAGAGIDDPGQRCQQVIEKPPHRAQPADRAGQQWTGSAKIHRQARHTLQRSWSV